MILCIQHSLICHLWFWFPFESPRKLWGLTGARSGPPGVTRGAHWGLEGFIGGHQGGLMACNDPAWDRVISGPVGLLFNAHWNVYDKWCNAVSCIVTQTMLQCFCEIYPGTGTKVISHICVGPMFMCHKRFLMFCAQHSGVLGRWRVSYNVFVGPMFNIYVSYNVYNVLFTSEHSGRWRVSYNVCVGPGRVREHCRG